MIREKGKKKREWYLCDVMAHLCTQTVDKVFHFFFSEITFKEDYLIPQWMKMMIKLFKRGLQIHVWRFKYLFNMPLIVFSNYLTSHHTSLRPEGR